MTSVKELAELLAKATPGPWMVMAKATPGHWTVMAPVMWIIDAMGMDLAHIRGWGFLTGKGQAHSSMDHDEAQAVMAANASLIALAWTLATDLIAMTADRDRLRDALTWYENSEIYKSSERGIAFKVGDLSYIARAMMEERNK